MNAMSSAYFGAPWPSGICEEGTQVPTPVGERCLLCGVSIEPDDQGSFVHTFAKDHTAVRHPVHKECSLREVLGGIGHLTNHPKYCVAMRDPDAGWSYRQSAVQVWLWVQTHGIEAAAAADDDITP